MSSETALHQGTTQPVGGAGPHRRTHRRLRAAHLVAPVVLLGFALAPMVNSSPFQLQVLMIAFLNAATVAALVISLGYVGLFNMSQGTFYGLGAYTTAILVTEHGWNFELAMLAAMLVAAAGGVLLCLTSARVKGDYFALVSLGFTIAVAQILSNAPALTRGREGYFGIPEMKFFGLSFNDPITSYYLCLGLLATVYLVVARVSTSFLGRAMRVVKTDEVVARSMGIRPFSTRVTAMVLSSGLAGICGAFLVGSIQFISPDDFDFPPSFVMTLYVIIGGMVSLRGAAVAALAFTILNEQIRELSDYSVGIVGIAVLIAVFARGGVLPDVQPSLRAAWRTVVGRGHHG